MSTLRKLATLATAAVVALSLAAAPASANGAYDYTAQIDCGAGVIEAGSGKSLYSPLVDLETGRKYKPVAWDVSGEDFAFAETKPGARKGSVVCSYDDGDAKGTVTLKRP